MADISTTTPKQTTHVNPDESLSFAWRKSYPGLAAIALFSIFINLLKLTIPLYVLQILDRVIASRSIETLIMLTTITTVAILCAVGLEVVRRRMFLHWGNWIELFIGPTLFATGLKTDSNQTPLTSKLIRDIKTIKSFVSSSGLIAWLDVVWTPLFIACAFIISPTLGYIVIISCLAALALGVINEYITRNSRESSYLARKKDRDWIASAERNQETVESLNMTDNFARLWSMNAASEQHHVLRSYNLHLYISAAMILVARFLRISVLGVGVWLVINDSLSLGAVIAASVLARIAYSLVQNAMLKWRNVVTANRAYSRIKSSLQKQLKTQLSFPISFNKCALDVINVSYRYPGNRSSIIRNVNLSLEPGDFLLVVGPSGSGKTTFTRLASGLLVPRSGNVLLGEIDLFRLQQSDTIADINIGKLSQDTHLFSGTVRENIARMSSGDFNGVIQAAKQVGIHSTILNLPAGYDTSISDNDPLLSYSQRKGIALARAFYGDPHLVLLDEPLPHLDQHARADLLKGIKELNHNGSIVIMTSQLHDDCEYADKVLILDNFSHRLLQTRKEILLFYTDGIIKSPQPKKYPIKRKIISNTDSDSKISAQHKKSA